jgi:hypothetical protein
MCEGWYEKLIRAGFDAPCRCYDHLSESELHELAAEETANRRAREDERKVIMAAKARRMVRDAVEEIVPMDDEEDVDGTVAGGDGKKSAYKLSSAEIAKLVAKSSMRSNMKRILKNKCLREPGKRLAFKLGAHLRRMFTAQHDLPNRESNIFFMSAEPNTGKSSLLELISNLAGDDAVSESTCFKASNQRQGMHGYATHGEYRFIFLNDMGAR